MYIMSLLDVTNAIGQARSGASSVGGYIIGFILILISFFIAKSYFYYVPDGDEEDEFVPSLTPAVILLAVGLAVIYFSRTSHRRIKRTKGAGTYQLAMNIMRR